jgi:C4-dicarboxylate transporter
MGCGVSFVNTIALAYSGVFLYAWVHLIGKDNERMGSQKIFIVRLEDGENIAQYTSQTVQPLAGDIIYIRHRNQLKPFEIVKTTLQPMVETYEIGVLIVKTPATSAIMRTMLHSGRLGDMFVGVFFGFILILFPILKKLRMKKER